MSAIDHLTESKNTLQGCIDDIQGIFQTLPECLHATKASKEMRDCITQLSSCLETVTDTLDLLETLKC